jgi:hypothetical protein
VINNNFILEKGEPSINCALRGITIDSSNEYENADDSIRVNRELDLNEMDESDLQYEKQNEPRISI